jgi:hypothetical protein
LRAERKAGQLLQEMDELKRGGSKSRPSTLKTLGISKDQSSRWQQLADVPDAQFEETLAAPEKPSATGILRQHPPVPEPMNPKALWLWGRLRDFERHGILEDSLVHLVSEMTEGMQADTNRLAVIVAAL